MADKVSECNTNNILILENAFSANRVKEEEYQDVAFVDDKVHISETIISIDSVELPKYPILDDMKQFDIDTTLDDIKTEVSLPEVKYDTLDDKLKMEEGLSADDIKIEFNNGFLYCEHCHVYFEDYCTECGMLVHILSKNILINEDNSSQEKLLPDKILEIQYYFGEFHIHALKTIPAGVRFGPFTGINTAQRSWKIKDGKFVVDKDKSKYLNWMQYINSAGNISERNLLVFQHEHNLYYKSTRQIKVGDELLVYFGEEYEDSLNGNAEMDFIPARENMFKDAFVCTFCCLGFSSKFYLAKHKTICPGNSAAEFSAEELMRCPSCKVLMGLTEHIQHTAYCWENSYRKDNPMVNINGCAPRPRPFYKCQQCKYRTKYKVDLKNHTNTHYEVKLYKCGICRRRFNTEGVLRIHVEKSHICAGKKNTGNCMKAHISAERSHLQDEMKQFKFSAREFGKKYKTSLDRHVTEKHLKEFKYKCGTCDYETNRKGSLKRHLETKHFKEFKYKCDTCHYGTNLKFALKTHINGKHSKEFKYKCDTCDYETNWKSALKTHTENKYLKEFKYKCDKCDYKTNYKSALKTHIENKHLKEFKYKCDKCDYKTNYKSALKTHIDTKHLEVFEYKCDRCD